MGKCKDCESWKGKPHTNGACLNKKFNEDLRFIVALNSRDGEMLADTIFTQEDFGCRHFKKGDK